MDAIVSTATRLFLIESGFPRNYRTPCHCCFLKSVYLDCELILLPFYLIITLHSPIWYCYQISNSF